MITVFNISLSTSRNETNLAKGIFPSTILLNDDSYYISLKNYAIPHTWYNISDKFKNNKFKYFKPENNFFEEITITDGNHDCDSFTFEMMKLFKNDFDKLPITFSEYPGSVNRIWITLKEGWKIDFTNYQIRFIFGFVNKVYENNENIRKDFIRQYPAKIEKDVRMVFIHCNLIKDSFIMDKKTNKLYQRNVIHSFNPDKSPGS